MSFLSCFSPKYDPKYGKNALIILFMGGFYIILPGFFGKLYYLLRVFRMRLRQANLSRLCKRSQHLSRLQTLVSSYHSNTSAQRSPSLAICTNSQVLSAFLESEHFEAEITRGADNENMENIENISLSLLYNYSFSYSHFAHPMRI